MQNNRILRLVLVTVLILLVPFIAMLFTDEVNWGPGDFAIIAVLLLGTGLVYELLVRKITNTTHRLMLGAGLVLVMLVIWADLAVGIFNIPGFSGS